MTTERNIKLVVAYEGTNYHGWQRQPGLPTVQGTIEQAARRVLRHQVDVVGSGRTDAGVHASGQVANVFTTCDIPVDNMRRAIGSRLPKDITIVQASEVPLGFDAIKSSRGKLYRYRVHAAEGRPAERHQQRYTYHFWQPLELEPMRRAARHMVGQRDFAAMASKGSPRESTVRTVLGIQIGRRYDEIHVDVQGRGFLYNQVRNMVGTLLEVGRGHWPAEYVAEIMAGRDRTRAGPTAPARGLCLQWVRYVLPNVRNEPVRSALSEPNEAADK